ncbi:transcription elongation factor GreAB [Shewanella gelidimarina]|uniref:transcription elongation factor GreAB n=1 Tax=Shewanella gelidimarina TaxID=56813 RepID=UPI00200D94A4|nr:transcription elongation factor GreAB [Shewanella gelidimarina]MCL1060048.1 transcription elongation factor GreAB [Shewanella gelidimarina]
MLPRITIEQSIRQALTIAHQDAVNAAKRAHDTATGSESVAENKYDTFGLEASYLAHGQSVRVAQCKEDMLAYEQLFAVLKQKAATDALAEVSIKGPKKVALGHLVELIDEDDKVSRLFMGPSAGGLKVPLDKASFMLITPQSPIGQKLLTCAVDDEIALTAAGKCHRYEISAIS